VLALAIALPIEVAESRDFNILGKFQFIGICSFCLFFCSISMIFLLRSRSSVAMV